MRYWPFLWCIITAIHIQCVVIIAPKQISSADLSAIAQAIKKAYPEPVVLDLSGQGLLEIPLDFFIGLINVSELYLQRNNLQEIPPTILDLQNLEILDCSENQLREVPTQIGDLCQLRILNLSHNHLKRIPDSFKQLARLQVLSLAYNQFNEIPSCIPGLYALNLATLAHNNIQALMPMRILTRLRLLDVSYNNLFEVNPDLLPTKLRVLLMNNNFVAEISGDLLALLGLQMLDLSGNSRLSIIGKAPPTIPLLIVDGAEFNTMRLFGQ